MISRLHPKFRRDFERLPEQIQERAREAYRHFVADSTYPGLQFKRLEKEEPLWSVRINDSYRAVGVRTKNDEIIWFFIGTHAEYDRLLHAR